ncbi:MAG: uroporphyrinogen decarboxylase family protein, partial [Kiritimatiellia bacterium]|nr:uroporphyrinogen decarboxylase family protein [Kiritimatiellia bacterium]
KRNGRIPMVIGTGKCLAAALPEADVRIPVSGPFSLACNLVGFDRLLCDTMDNPRIVRRALDHLACGQIAFAREILSQGLGVAFFESGATPPLLSPEVFAQVELPVLKHIIRETSLIAGRPVPCIIGGNTLPVLDSILDTGTGYVICPYETDQASFMQHMAAHPDVMVRINTDPGVFSAGNLPTVHREVERVLALAGRRQKVCIGTGALPFETDPNLVLMAKEIVRQWKVVRQPTHADDGITHAR